MSVTTNIRRAYSEHSVAFHNMGLHHANRMDTTGSVKPRTGFGIREENGLSVDMDALRAIPSLKIECVALTQISVESRKSSIIVTFASTIVRMEDLLFSINAVAPLFIQIAAGYVARRVNFVSDRFLAEANRFVFKFLLPLMLFQNIRSTFHGDFTNGTLICVAAVGISAVIAVSLCIVPLFVKRRGQCGSMVQGIYRSNFLIYGMPLATGMYGQSAAQSISMLMGVMIPFYNIAAVVILSFFSETRKDSVSLRRLLAGIVRNPLIIGCVAGMLFGMLHADLPAAVDRPAGDLAAAASPLALFLMGGEFKFRGLGNNLWKVFAATAARLIIVPLAAMLTFIPMGFRAVELSVLLCIFATPTAVSSYIMAGNMGCDGELSGQIVVLTTVGSCLSIFLFVFVLRHIGVL